MTEEENTIDQSFHFTNQWGHFYFRKLPLLPLFWMTKLEPPVKIMSYSTKVGDK